jgi:hypothetical protein
MREITVSRYRTQYPYIENISDYGLGQSGVCRNFKNEATWCRMLGHYDAEYDTARRVIRWAVAREAFCT